LIVSCFMVFTFQNKRRATKPLHYFQGCARGEYYIIVF
jgi:hypothetical protein